MGYGIGVKGYRIWSIDERKVINSRDVFFDENSMLLGKKCLNMQDSGGEKVSEQVEYELDVSDEASRHTDQSTSAREQPVSSPGGAENQPQSYSIEIDRPQRQVSQPVHYGFEDMVAYALQVAEEVEFF